MTNRSGIEAIIFDLDGVLVRGEDWHEQAFILAMADYGYDVDSRVKRKGYTTLQRLKALEKQGRAPSNYTEIAALKNTYTMDLINKNCKPDARIIKAVEFAYIYTRGKVAVATNCSPETAHRMLELSGIKHLFPHIITNADVEGKVKPHPRPYAMASSRLGIYSKECLVIDDSDIGIKSALEARCYPVRLNHFESLTVEFLMSRLKKLEIRL